VRRWLLRFSAAGIDGLGNRPGCGRKRRITEAERSRIMALARSAPPGQLARDEAGELSADDKRGPAQWTLDTLSQAGQASGIRAQRSQVRRVLLAEKVRGFIPDGILDQLPLPSTVGAVRTGGIDLNKPRIRAILAAALALAPAPGGFTVAELAARVAAMTGTAAYTIRQAAYDLRKLRGQNLIIKPGRTRRYQVPPDAVRAIAALLTLRDHVIAPILAGVRSPRRGRPPAHWTQVDRDYQTLRIGMQALFRDLGIETLPAAA
jgi:Homeodomain-like domain